ncbi:MAG: hypothetical protein AB7S55_04380 [Thiomonas sp.]
MPRITRRNMKICRYRSMMHGSMPAFRAMRTLSLRRRPGLMHIMDGDIPR